MKKITMMYLKGCPYCKQAMNWMEELKQEQPVYQNINITYIEESEQPQLADTLDYWYVPTYFVDGIKKHEGAATKDKIKAVFDAAL
ncbi:MULTISPECIES: glutaredoxin family protein [Bacillota]|jgi:glutaredoxin|uniref:Thioredoxin family protein n=2 Tax=Amedibacillus TaxID=2749846 RepID=A0A7G9GMR2_9FIRM|nr:MULTISPECIES: thioredoxin family protein [Bacillota]QNM12094.1 thioredoxin family protein [[Eubacterium] hominis]MCH4286553.1 thioredoxin family protein [Amedibacillus hominis]RGB53160.1 thioredoxin [Absiella sp. AM22-9]RGB59450.1 thioredoxin [Absiella sp. AM10-20]RGB66577.1 thioredoxin [Absiella sp. AM09-45]